ncbi:MAG TPA: alpha/beta fold hydrolase [Bacteroidota bacterium]
MSSIQRLRAKPLTVKIALVFIPVVVLGWVAYAYAWDSREYNVNTKALGSLIRTASVFQNSYGDTAHMESFRLVVQEKRSNATSNHIKLAFDRFSTTAANPLPPVFFLAGGPGSSGRRFADTEYFYLFREIQKLADVVLIDQRGTGASIPSLQLSGDLNLPTDVSENIEPVLLQSLTERVQEALEEIKNNGVDITAYNSEENADDLDEIREALGYEKVSLMGYSYGTELSMVYMRRHPERVHNAVMSGPLAPDMALKLPLAVQTQFEGLDSLAKLDKRLSKYMPNFLKTMNSVHEQLRQAPADIKVPLMDAVGDDAGVIGNAIFSTIAFFKPNWEMTMGDLHLQLMAQNYIGNDFWLRRFPSFYYRISQGDYRQVGNILRNFRRQAMPNGLIFTTNCATGFTDERFRLALVQERQTPLKVNGISFGRMEEECTACGLSRLGDEVLAPVTSERPVLFIIGTLDGRTPIQNLPELQRRFNNSQAIIIENGGHNALIGETIRDGILEFLQGSKVSVIKIRRDIEFEPLAPYQHSLGDTLRAILLEKGKDAMKELYSSLKREYGESDDYLYDFSELSLNFYGYQLFEENKVEVAKTILEFNMELFPESFNVYDSYAEALMLSGDKAGAIKNYEKSVELNFFNVNGRAQLNQLRQQPSN